MYMHCRIRVADFSKWKAEMEADAKAQRNAGMRLIHLWRGVEEPNTAFFVSEVHRVEKALAFLNPGAVLKPRRQRVFWILSGILLRVLRVIALNRISLGAEYTREYCLMKVTRHIPCRRE